MEREALLSHLDHPGGRQPATGSLELVQAFVNTVDREHGPDLFDDDTGLEEWLGRRMLAAVVRPGDREPPQRRPSDQHGSRPQGERSQHVTSGPYAAVDEHLRAVRHFAQDFGKSHRGRDRSVELTAAVVRHDQARRARVDAIVATSRQNGRIFHLSGPAAFARNLAMAAVPATRLMARYDWVYGWRPPV